jgi:hypothetical protein
MVKDIVVEEDLNPEVDKPGRRMKLDARAQSVEKEMPDIDWDKESVPLQPTPGETVRPTPAHARYTLRPLQPTPGKQSVPIQPTPGK